MREQGEGRAHAKTWKGRWSVVIWGVVRKGLEILLRPWRVSF